MSCGKGTPLKDGPSSPSPLAPSSETWSCRCRGHFLFLVSWRSTSLKKGQRMQGDENAVASEPTLGGPLPLTFVCLSQLTGSGVSLRTREWTLEAGFQGWW